jgi:polysaccharide biosynthesis/export protein
MSRPKSFYCLKVTLFLITCILGMETVQMPLGLTQSVMTPVSQSVNQLKAGDRIRLTVTGFPELSGEQIIMTDGTLQFPLAGSVAIAGQTPAEAVNTITTALRPYIRRPQVGLAIVSVRPLRISVTGAVLHPGPRLLTPVGQQQSSENTPNTGGETFQTLSYALLLAGGITPDADIRNITIQRLEPNPETFEQSNSRRTEIKANLWQAIQTGDLSADPQLLDGDEIIVPTAQIGNADQQQMLTSTIAPGQITVQIAGAVRNPGSVQISPSAGASTAIAAAGGLTNDASRRLTLLRMSSDGNLERSQLEFGENSAPLRQGDVIVVSRTAFSSILNAAGTLLSPITSLIFLFR